MGNPLVSICIMFHNQKDYVERTLAGAFSQTYSPLEIVISDDGSTDGTSELLERLLRQKYASRNDLQVILNRNEKALGMLGNREKVYGLAHGELLVNADGDDISFPQRVELLTTAWLAQHKKPTMVTSEAVIVDEYDRPLGLTSFHGKPIGATLAIAAAVIPFFPPVCHDAAYHAHDDLVFHLRASLLGNTIAVDQPLIYYRYGSGESSGGKYRKKMVRGFTGLVSGLRQILLDLQARQDILPLEKVSSMTQRAKREIAFCEAILPLWSSPSFLARLKSCRQTKYYRRSTKLLLVSLLLLLPQGLGDFLFGMAEKLHRFICRRRARNLDMAPLDAILAKLQ